MERVYVGNLPPDIRIKDIDDFFRPFGKLVAIDVNNRSNPAFAFVQFDSQRNALSAVRNRHGYDYEGYTLQVKLVENNVGSFEVRNQSRQVTPPPPPPMFNNDFNNQSQMGGGFGNNNFGRNGGNFGGNNFGSNNFGSNNFGSNNFGNDFNLSSSSSFQRNMPSQNMIQYPSKNVRSIMPAQNNMIEYPINKGWGSGGGGAGVSNRGGGGGFSNRGGRSDMGNDFNNMGGGYSFNPNNNCYADDNFEDRFTQGLSGSGRKWFNRYIQKGFAPKIAREKAIEHRTLPYLRDGPKSNQIANNAVANLPLPALENFGNKLISLFSGNGGGGGNFGGNANQMMPNFNNWGNNMQGGFSNDFNTAGPGSSNYRSGNRNTDRALMPRRGGGAAMNRNVKPNTAKGPESGILDKMLAEVDRDQSELTSSNEVNRDLTTVVKGAQCPIGTVVFNDVAPLPMDKNPNDYVLNVLSDEDDNYSKSRLQMSPKSDSKFTPVFDELKLYKAEQKRMKTYLKQGIDVEVARLLCKKYVHDLRNELLRSNEETKDTISNFKDVLISANEVKPVFDKIKLSKATQERHRYLLKQGMSIEETPKQCRNSVPEFPYLRKEIFELNVNNELKHFKDEQDEDSEVVGLEKICEGKHISELNKNKKTFCNMQLDKKLAEEDIRLTESEATSSMPPEMKHSEEEKSSNSQNDKAKPVTDRVKLCGAARKRLRLYLDEGIAVEEARKLCQKPMREVRKEVKVKTVRCVRSETTDDQISTKRSDDKTNSVCKRKNNIKGKTTLSNRSKIPDIKRTAEKAATKVENVVKNISHRMPLTIQHNDTSCKETKEINIKIGVIPPDYPKTLWPDNKLTAIKEAILDKIVEQRKGSIKPKFSNCGFKPGYITFTCRDNETSDWMLKIVPTLKPWQKAALKVVTEIEIPKTSVIVGYFPDDTNTTNEIIFGRIGSQNGDLLIDYWKVLKRSSKGSSIELTISIDPISAKVFKRNDYSIYYKYGKVNVRPIKSRQQPNAAEKSM